MTDQSARAAAFRFVLVAPACGIGFEDALAFRHEHGEKPRVDLLRALRLGRIVKPPMVTVHLSWEHGTGLIGVPADRNDGLDLA